MKSKLRPNLKPKTMKKLIRRGEKTRRMSKGTREAIRSLSTIGGSMIYSRPERLRLAREIAGLETGTPIEARRLEDLDAEAKAHKIASIFAPSVSYFKLPAK